MLDKDPSDYDTAAMLARLLFDRDAQGAAAPYGAKTRPDTAVESTLADLGPCVSVERVGVPSAQRWEEGDEIPPYLEAAIFDRTLDIAMDALLLCQ